MQYLNNIKTSCKDFLNVFSTFENLVKTEGVKISLQTWKLWKWKQMFPIILKMMNSLSKYEHIRPIARLFRNTELIGTKFNSEIQGHFVDDGFIADIYWSNNDVVTLVDKKIEIPVSNTVVATFCKYSRVPI